ncbi:MAG: metallophosphoesterase [Eubacteriales bacterium]
MGVYAIADLHLSGFREKPMNIFGENWNNHWEKIKDSWHECVKDGDVVLIPGDISWAMKLNEVKVDIDEVCALPGKKILLRGNHDYWWSSLTKVNSILSNNTYALQNNSFIIGDYVIVGTRGWTMSMDKATSQDLVIYNREVERLKLSVASVDEVEAGSRARVAMFHFPPFNETHSPSELTDILAQFKVSEAVYGHLHEKSLKGAFNGPLDGVNYSLVSCDYLDFKLKKII